MHNNYYFLRQLTRQMREEFSSYRVHEIYSQQKDELIISIYKGDETGFIVAHLGNSFSGLSFPQIQSRARRNSVELFREVAGLLITDILQIENDRSFYLQFEGDYKLLFKMHGSRSNILLFKHGQVYEIFRNNLKKDFGLEVGSLSKHVELSREIFHKHEGDYKKIFPTFGSDFDSYFQEINYSGSTADQQFTFLDGLLKKIETPLYYLHIDDKKFPKLSLYPLAETDLVFKEPIKALNALYRSYITDYYLESEKSKLRNALLDQIRKGESYIAASLQKLNALHDTASYAHIGDLIMANLHNIPARQATVKLEDFYTQKPVSIKLNQNLSPQLNAEKYYKKARKQQIEIATLEQHINTRKQHIADIQAQIDQLAEIHSLRQLKKNPTSEEAPSNSPFHKVEFMDFEILIGKNARTNEMLTFSVAGKDDLFLHTKDAPGSHVIIRAKAKRNFPVAVIEKAAAYAAFYSKYKGESLIRVLYTQKKYVRKAKGMPAGTVIATNEKVLLVSPEEIKK
jgi:predicted ribosome quality control (RQC) complex YloA/Tae2 family protein